MNKVQPWHNGQGAIENYTSASGVSAIKLFLFSHKVSTCRMNGMQMGQSFDDAYKNAKNNIASLFNYKLRLEIDVWRKPSFLSYL